MKVIGKKYVPRRFKRGDKVRWSLSSGSYHYGIVVDTVDAEGQTRVVTNVIPDGYKVYPYESDLELVP